MTADYKQLSKNVDRLAAANETLVELSTWMQQFCLADLQRQMIYDEDILNRELHVLQVAFQKAASQMSTIIEHK